MVDGPMRGGARGEPRSLQAEGEVVRGCAAAAADAGATEVVTRGVGEVG